MEKPLQERVSRIVKECEEAGATKWDILKIIKDLETCTTNNLEEMRDTALAELEKINPNAARVYSSFRKMRVYTSAENIEPFDRGNIIKSLLRETDVSRSVAEKIGSEVENQIKDLKIKRITTALIRTMVNVKLLEYGQESVYSQYTRVGLPVFDVDRIEKPCEGMMREYNLLKVIPEVGRKLHYQNKIFIAAVGDFANKVYSVSYVPEIKGGDAETALLGIILGLKKLQNRVSLPVNINSLNFHLSKLAEKMPRKKLDEFAGVCVRVLDEFYGRAGEYRKAAVGLDLYEEVCFEKKCNKKAAIDFALRCIEHYKRGKRNFNLKIFVDSSYNLKHLESRHFYSGLYFVNCRDKRVEGLNGAMLCGKQGIIQLAAINLPLIASNSLPEKEFFEEIGVVCGGLEDLFNKKQEILKEKVSGFVNCVGIYGLGQAMKVLGGKEKTETMIYETVKEKLPAVEILFYEGRKGEMKLGKANNGIAGDKGVERNYVVAKSRTEIEKLITGNKCVKLAS